MLNIFAEFITLIQIMVNMNAIMKFIIEYKSINQLIFPYRVKNRDSN
jgi:hypothetical protein